MSNCIQQQYLASMGITVWKNNIPDGFQVPDRRGVMRQKESTGIYMIEAESTPPPQKNLKGEGDSSPSVMPVAGSELFDAMQLSGLADEVAACRACDLCHSRKQTVFGVGNPRADLLLVGEAPGVQEDLKGEPFVGRAGQLLDLMLLAIGLSRSQIYIANILKCRPPHNRDPTPDEVQQCTPFLLQQIALIQPKLIVALGRVSAHYLLNSNAKISMLRREWFQYGEHKTPLRVTYHPAYLLRNPEDKRRAWEDLCVIKNFLAQL